MKCDESGCNQKASVHLTEIVNGNITKLNLCEYCAQKKGSQLEQHFGIADLLQGLADFEESLAETPQEKVKCPKCGISFDEFKKIGRLGCAECYNAFHEKLNTLLKRIHGSSKHVGKIPKKSADQVMSKEMKAKETKLKKSQITSELTQLRTSLQTAVQKENYEEAARLRDRIKQLEDMNVHLGQGQA